MRNKYRGENKMMRAVRKVLRSPDMIFVPIEVGLILTLFLLIAFLSRISQLIF